MFTTIRDAYNHFAQLFGSETPVWTRDQLQAWVKATGKRYEELTDEDMDAAYDAALEDDASDAD